MASPQETELELVTQAVRQDGNSAVVGARCSGRDVRALLSE